MAAVRCSTSEGGATSSWIESSVVADFRLRLGAASAARRSSTCRSRCLFRRRLFMRLRSSRGGGVSGGGSVGRQLQWPARDHAAGALPAARPFLALRTRQRWRCGARPLHLQGPRGGGDGGSSGCRLSPRRVLPPRPRMAAGRPGRPPPRHRAALEEGRPWQRRSTARMAASAMAV